MNKVFISIIVAILSSISLSAQHYELGVNFGGGNYIGDIGSEYYFKPKKLGGGIMFKNVVNPWYSIRMDLSYRAFNPDDAEAESAGRQIRQLSASAFIVSLDLGIEYYFRPMNPYKFYRKGHRFRPYIFSGVGIGSINGKLFKHQEQLLSYSSSSFYIPMKIGFKYKISSQFLIGVETGARYYFSDNIDGTKQLYGYTNSKIDGEAILETTNLNSNDWSTFTSISLIYTFGDLRCYFNVK